MNETFTFTDKTKRLCQILIGIGVIGLIWGYITDGQAYEDVAHYNHNRFWGNILINSFFFMGISLAATFFLALQYAAEAGWSTTIKRVIEAVTSFLPYGLGLMFILLVLGFFRVHNLYEWMNGNVFDKHSPEFDEKIAHKQGYLHPIFFFVRTIAYILVWGFFQRLFRQRSIEADLNGDSNYVIHFKNVRSSAIFLVFFGFTSSTMAWDWMMSIDIHWFSTMFGWYTFAGMFISAIITITILTLWLKKQGYLKEVQPSTIHDMGKWMFAISFLWSYLYFMQFMLIWYTNVPEEVSYFYDRIHQFNYRWPMWLTFFVNFAFPMAILISRDAKRNYSFLTFVGICIFLFHWMDIFNMVMPASVHQHWHIAITEIFIFAGFLGAFLMVVLTSLSKQPLMVKTHPFLEESKHLHT